MSTRSSRLPIAENVRNVLRRIVMALPWAAPSVGRGLGLRVGPQALRDQVRNASLIAALECRFFRGLIARISRCRLFQRTRTHHPCRRRGLLLGLEAGAIR